MFLKRLLVISYFLFLIGIASFLHACTEFRVRAKDGSVIIGRSMEFPFNLHSNIVVQPKGYQYISKAPGNKDGLKWTSKYGVIYLDAFDVDASSDGLNEKGLSCGALYLPGFAAYQSVPEGKEDRALSNLYFVLWILGNFATVDEVRNALPSIFVWDEAVDLGNDKVKRFPLHYSIYDEQGNGLVVEYTEDGLKLYDNEVGVLTNSPTYNWHVINLRNYIDLTSFQVKPITMDGVTLAPLGQGIGLRAIPGDPTPPSRFIRAAAMVHFANPVDKATEAVNLALHVLNTVDIPLGIIKDKVDGVVHKDYTQWIVVKNLKNKQLYYRSYNNQNIKQINATALDLTEKGKRLQISVEEGSPAFIDVTKKLHTPSNKS